MPIIAALLAVGAFIAVLYLLPIYAIIIVVITAPLSSYPMALIYWFITDHATFWPGFKELIWALCPIANIFYVWDWWVIVALTLYNFVSEYWDWLAR